MEGRVKRVMIHKSKRSRFSQLRMVQECGISRWTLISSENVSSADRRVSIRNNTNNMYLLINCNRINPK